MRQNDNEEHLEATVGMVKKSTDTRSSGRFSGTPAALARWFAMTKAILLDRGFRHLMPSLRHLPWMRGELQRGIAEHILRIKALTHRGKPPAPPGDSPRFDLYDGPREFLISAKRKEIHDERVPEPEPYEMGLQISRGVYSEATEEAGIRSVTATAWGDFSRIGLTQGVHDRGGTHDGRPCAHVLEHCAQIRGLERGWITEGEERDPDCAQVRRPPEKFHRRALLGQGVLRFHGRAGREHRSSVHPQLGRAAMPCTVA